MQDSDTFLKVRQQVSRALDAGIANDSLLDHLATRIIDIAIADQTNWLRLILQPGPSSDAVAPELRAIVGDVLYEHGLASGRVGPVLAPHTDAWSPPAREELEPLQISDRDLTKPDAVMDRYDAVVIGSGAGGGIAAQTLAENGWTVLVVERGNLPKRSPLLTDHLRTPRAASGLFPRSGPGPESESRQVRFSMSDVMNVRASHPLWNNNAMTLGGGTRVYGAQAWRFTPQDFSMASTYGVPEGSSLADWPLTYDDLEPFYTRVEQSLGVSGGPSQDPWAGPRSAELPMPPFRRSPLGEILGQAARKLGIATQPVPLLVNTQPYGGRSACIQCSQCVGFDCPVGARAGSHNTTLPAALATGNASVLAGTQVSRVLARPDGRAHAVVLVGDQQGQNWRRTVSTGLVVLAAGAIESARLLLDSADEGHPGGLGNDTDQVGRHLQGHAYGGASALFDEEVVDLKGPGPVISTADFRHGNDGIIGGGILANEFVPTPASTQRSLYETGLVDAETPVGSPSIESAMLRFARVMGPIQEVTTPSSRVTIDRGRADRFGRSTVRLEGTLHSEDLRGRELLTQRATEWLTAAGAIAVRPMPPMTLPTSPSGGQHQAGTCRMGTDPMRSVVDPQGRVWGHDNIVIADGSTHVTNGGVNPVLTILANSLRITEGVVKDG